VFVSGALSWQKVGSVTDEALNNAREKATVTDDPAVTDAKDVMANVMELFIKISSDFLDITLQLVKSFRETRMVNLGIVWPMQQVCCEAKYVGWRQLN
jgi:hypothetical protein